MSYVALEEAADTLKTSSAALCVSKKYKAFYVPSEKGSRNAKFDVQGFLKADALRSELIEKTRLLTEYLNKIEGMTYQQMGDLAKVSPQQIAICLFGYNVAVKVAKGVRDKHKDEWRRFHEWYGWKCLI